MQWFKWRWAPSSDPNQPLSSYNLQHWHFQKLRDPHFSQGLSCTVKYLIWLILQGKLVTVTDKIIVWYSNSLVNGALQKCCHRCQNAFGSCSCLKVKLSNFFYQTVSMNNDISLASSKMNFSTWPLSSVDCTWPWISDVLCFCDPSGWWYLICQAGSQSVHQHITLVYTHRSLGHLSYNNG